MAQVQLDQSAPEGIREGQFWKIEDDKGNAEILQVLKILPNGVRVRVVQSPDPTRVNKEAPRVSFELFASMTLWGEAVPEPKAPLQRLYSVLGGLQDSTQDPVMRGLVGAVCLLTQHVQRVDGRLEKLARDQAGAVAELKDLGEGFTGLLAMLQGGQAAPQQSVEVGGDDPDAAAAAAHEQLQRETAAEVAAANAANGSGTNGGPSAPSAAPAANVVPIQAQQRRVPAGKKAPPAGGAA